MVDRMICGTDLLEGTVQELMQLASERLSALESHACLPASPLFVRGGRCEQGRGLLRDRPSTVTSLMHAAPSVHLHMSLLPAFIEDILAGVPGKLAAGLWLQQALACLISEVSRSSVGKGTMLKS